MRNLKRALSLALASIMVLGMMVVGAGAVSVDEFSDSEKIVNKEAVSVLTTLNVINGKEDGSYDPEGIVTRAEMAKMICVVLNGGKDPQLGAVVTDTYTDTTTHWAKAFIEYCTNLGIVAGRGDGAFDPNGTVTVSEAAKMLLVAVGYNATIEGYVGGQWQINTDVKANQEDLYEGIATENTSVGLTRDNAAQMVYNALECQMVKYEYVVQTDGSVVTTKPQVTNSGLGNVLEEKFGAVKVEAIVVGNEYGTVYSNNYADSEDEGQTYLDVKSISNSKQVNSSVPKDEEWTSADGLYDLSTSKDLLGQRVVLYVRYKDTVGYDEKDAIVIGSPIPVGKNRVVESTDGTKGSKVADDENLSFTDSTVFLVNFGGYYDGVVYGDDPAKANTEDNPVIQRADKDATVKTMTAAQFDVVSDITGVTVRLIDNNGDKKVDYALAEKHSYGMVNKYSEADKGAFRIQNFFKEDDYKAADVVGFDDVAQGDLVLYIEYGGKVYVQKPEFVEAKLESYSTSKMNLKLDGETIKWSGLKGDVLADQQWIGEYLVSGGTLDTSAYYYKDTNGYVFGVGETDESLLNFAVVLGFENQTASTSGVLGKEAKAKLLLSDGTVGTYSIATIDGKKVTNCNRIASNGALVPAGDEVGFDLDDQYNVYTYTKTDSGQMKLTLKSTLNHNNTSATSSSANVHYKRGESTISVSGSNYTVSDRTIFLYSKPDGSVARYQGKTAPSVVDATTNSGERRNTEITVRENSRGEALIVFLNGVKPSADFKDNFIYVYNTKVAENGDAYEVAGILDGKIDTFKVEMAYNAAGAEVITPDITGAGIYKHRIPVGIYNYDKDGDTYTLTQRNVGSNAITGKVLSISSDYIRIEVMGLNTVRSGAASVAAMGLKGVGPIAGISSGDVGSKWTFTLTDKSVLFESRKDETARTAPSINVGDTVTLVVNDDGQVVYGFLTQFAWEVGTEDTTPKGDSKITFYTNQYAGYTFYVNGTDVKTFAAEGVGMQSFSVKSTDTVTVLKPTSAVGVWTTSGECTVATGITGTVDAAAGTLTFKAANALTLGAPGSYNGAVPPPSSIDANITIGSVVPASFTVDEAHVITASDNTSGGKYDSMNTGDLYIAFTAPDGMSMTGATPDISIQIGSTTYDLTGAAATLISGNTYKTSVATASVPAALKSGSAATLDFDAGSASSYKVSYVPTDGYTMVGGSDTLETLSTSAAAALKFELKAPSHVAKAKISYTVEGTANDGDFTTTELTVSSGKLAVTDATESTDTTASGPVTITITKVEVTAVNVVVDSSALPSGVSVALNTATDTFAVGTGGANIPNLKASGLSALMTGVTFDYEITGVTGKTDSDKLSGTTTEQTVAAGAVNNAAMISGDFVSDGTAAVKVTITGMTYTKADDASHAVLNIVPTGAIGGQTISSGIVSKDGNDTATAFAVEYTNGSYTNKNDVTVTLTFGSAPTANANVEVSFPGGECEPITFKTVNNTSNPFVIPAGALTFDPAAGEIVVLVKPVT